MTVLVRASKFSIQFLARLVSAAGPPGGQDEAEDEKGFSIIFHKLAAIRHNHPTQLSPKFSGFCLRRQLADALDHLRSVVRYVSQTRSVVRKTFTFACPATTRLITVDGDVTSDSVRCRAFSETYRKVSSTARPGRGCKHRNSSETASRRR